MNVVEMRNTGAFGDQTAALMVVMASWVSIVVAAVVVLVELGSSCLVSVGKDG